MKIAIVGPSPVPYVYGGVEGLLWKLTESINNYTVHQAELIKLPTKELSFWDLIDSYHKFYTLDLSHFDLVISTKYPAWMVKHKNHIVYLQHHLRGLFDTYHFCNEPLTIPPNLRVGLVKNIFDIIKNYKTSEKNIDEIFEKLKELKNEEDNYDTKTFTFPGPFIREIIHFFDNYALSKELIKRYFAISNNVKNRKDYFPRNANVEVVYHPSKIDSFQCNSYDYLFTVSRLDAPKRIDILIKSMKYVPHKIKFKIAGIGPDEKKLKELARKDDRIEFIGYVNEEKLVNIYSNALATLFIPFDEDYGLITIESMMSAKPVITTNDSGGSLEFVNNSETGFVTEPNPQSIAEKINYLIENKDAARQMGERAYEIVKDITWRNTVNNLLGDSLKEKKNLVCIPEKKKILVLSTYSIFPPRGGGQHRLYNLYKNLSKKFDVTVLSLIEFGKTSSAKVLDNDLKTVCIPQSEKHARLQWDVEQKLGLGLFDVLCIENVVHSIEYVEKMKELAKKSDIIICSHPYLFNLIKKENTRQIIVYDAIDIEFVQKESYLKKSKNYNLIDQIWEIEKRACSESDIIFATSAEERNTLSELYKVPVEKIFIVPNGVDIKNVPFFTIEEKRKQKELLGLSDYTTVLFVGSWHPPNLEAMKFIVDILAKKRKDFLFFIVGSINDYYKNQSHLLKRYPKNVMGFGVVDELEKIEIYKASDIAINPMMSGSGTNLKMLDYMASGIPIISTPIGARGLEIEDNVIISDPENFNEAFDKIIAGELDTVLMSENARCTTQRLYDWDKISQYVTDIFNKLLFCN
ncbi:MAG: glycosyltransferase [Candidatus Methanoperedens sp.]|nr:glycosyltransferase [Candidatus Methanoperedens sp.]